MAQICAHCGSSDTEAGFDRYQCLACGGYTHYSGTPTVPTSALAADANTFDGPGGEAIPAPGFPPFKATNATDQAGPVPADGSTTEPTPEPAVPPQGPPDEQPTTGAPVPSEGTEAPAPVPAEAPPEEVPPNGEAVQQGA